MDYLIAFPEFVMHEILEVDSTNLYVERLIRNKSLPEGSVIYTYNQTAGIGQGENKWESEPYKNLIATIILNPVLLNPADQFYLTMVVSLATCDTIDSFLKTDDTLIKWPNDIYSGHRKIAGILIKNFILGSNISNTIAGIGINVNQTTFKSAPIATSLKIISGLDYDIKAVLTKWHTSLAYYYIQLNQNKKTLRDLYLSRMYLKDQYADYLINNTKVSAKILGIDQHGQLELTTTSGNKYTCGLKEIVFPVIG